MPLVSYDAKKLKGVQVEGPTQIWSSKPNPYTSAVPYVIFVAYYWTTLLVSDDLVSYAFEWHLPFKFFLGWSWFDSDEYFLKLKLSDVSSSQRLLVTAKYSDPVSKINFADCLFEPILISPAKDESWSMFDKSTLICPCCRFSFGWVNSLFWV